MTEHFDLSLANDGTFSNTPRVWQNFINSLNDTNIDWCHASYNNRLVIVDDTLKEYNAVRNPLRELAILNNKEFDKQPLPTSYIRFATEQDYLIFALKYSTNVA